MEWKAVKIIVLLVFYTNLSQNQTTARKIKGARTWTAMQTPIPLEDIYNEYGPPFDFDPSFAISQPELRSNRDRDREGDHVPELGGATWETNEMNERHRASRPKASRDEVTKNPNEKISGEER